LREQFRKPRMGLLLLGAERFCRLGEGTARGTYLKRKQDEAAWMLADCQKIADVTFPGIVFTRDDVISAMDAFICDKVDYVLAIYLSWAEDFAWNRFLRDMPPVPVLFAHRMRDEINLKDTHDSDEFTEYLCCGGLVGMQEASGNNTNFKRPMLETTLGTWSQIMGRAEVFGNAARARTILKNGTIGLLACYNEAMWSTYVHPYDVFQKVGPELRFLSVAELNDTIEEISEADASLAMKDIASRFEVLPNVREDKFLASVRASMAMERMAKKYKLDLLVLNDIDTVLFKQVGLRPGFYPTRPDVNTIVVPEGDIGGGLATYILHLLTGGHVHFIEPFHIDLLGGNFAAGHAGPNDYTDPEGKTKISIDVRFATSPWKHAGAPFAWHVFSPGRKTMLHCSEHNGRFLFAATLIDSLPCEHFLATYSHGLFRPVGQTSPELFEKLLRIGVTQHYGIASGDCIPAIEDLSMMLDFDYHKV
jgi:L-arabinose isomerase